MPRKIDPSSIKVGTGLSANNSVDNNALTDKNKSSGLKNHVQGGNSHEASDISVDPNPPLYQSGNVEGVLNELAALRPPQPPTLGNESTLLSFSGITDWGVFKLNDGGLSTRGLTTSNADADIYPYYFQAPEVADDFSNPGEDPKTDPTFNISDGGYVGGGNGTTHAGGFERSGALEQTTRITTHNLAQDPVILSGAVYPADKGVLSLLYFPANATVGDFLAQGLTTRCRAAILLGSGVGSDCDGSPGGMFSPGETSGTYDPFAFPGQASGQYNLQEIHSGTSSTGGPAPVADNTAGQVRLGTDPAAGITPVANGIPILGATTSAIGGIGNDNNFFRYRLPYMSDYSDTSGLIYTSELEKPRYFTKPAVSLNPGTDLTQAGDYNDFPKDYWFYQVARYRHQFLTESQVGPADAGTFILVHFKTEASFEALVRDGVAPSDDQMYSANVVDWATVESDLNVLDGSGNTASSYHVLRAKCFRDPNGLVPPIPSASPQNEFDYTTVTDQVMVVSGVKYFIPRDVSVDGTPSFQINSLSLEVSGLWIDAYRTSDDTTITDMNPGIMSFSTFSFSENGGIPTLTTAPANALVNNSSRIRKQRIEFAQEDLFAGVPTTADLASATLAGTIDFDGDDSAAAFSTNAKPHLFFRKPQGHDTIANTLLPTGGVDIDPADGNRVLYHSARKELSTNPTFGNYLNGINPFNSLFSATKDTKEFFLDEAYRYHSQFPVLTGSDPALAVQLTGPGLPGGSSSIEIPVRSGITADPTYIADSYIPGFFYLDDLAVDANVLTEAQVCGLPERNPPLSDGVANPFPASGLLKYPQDNYLIGFRPSFIDGDVTAPLDQFDYSGATGDRSYVRVFDASFDGTEDVVGSTFITLRVDGLQLSDYEYSAPGPGSDAISIMVKIPGLTTWMDIGRRDGNGPSKQDAVLDGAGCKIIGPGTFDGIDATNGIVYSQTRIHLGPSAALFENSGASDPGSAGEVPVMVKVTIKDTVSGRALDFSDGNPTISSNSVRGLTSLELIPPST